MVQPVHFLERLARATPRQAADAAELVRDPALVRTFLDKASERDPALRGADRYALPLGAEPAPAHVIVARDGNPVTCLGAGMPMHGVPVVPRAWVEGFATEAREAWKAAQVLRRVESESDPGQDVVTRWVEDPGSITDADMATLEALVPLLGDPLGEAVQQATELFRGTPPPIRRVDTMDDPAVALLWRRYLCGTWATWLGGAQRLGARTLVLLSATPDVMVASRASWWASRRGADTVEVLEELAHKHGLVGGEHEIGVAVALHHPLLAPRVKALARHFRRREGAGYMELVELALSDPTRAVDHAVISMLRLLPALLDPAAVVADPTLDARALGASLRALGNTAALRPMDVGARLHRALPRLLERWLHGDPAESARLWRTLLRRTPLRFNLFPMGTVLLSRAPREAFLPGPTANADHADAAGVTYLRTITPAFQPVDRDPVPVDRPGPNAPCPCGSGRKYKKCHGAT